uniref:Uncharacterized protein n=1 Tax=Plectus sambesii TaxID=2011161 RepID=A0A914VZY9_9BILA
QVVEVASKVPADDSIIQDRAPDIRDLKRFSKSKKLVERAAKRARFIISECKQQVGEYGLSSDDEPDPTAAKTPVTACGEGTLMAPHTTDIQMHQPLYLGDVKDLVREYRILQEVEPDSPSLDFSDVRLDEVYERAGLPFGGERQSGGSKAKPSKLAAPATPRAKSPANAKPPA